METLEQSKVCRLCGKHATTTFNLFVLNGNQAKKINSILPILVHEMDLLPKHLCHLCSHKLDDFYEFYADCLRVDIDLKSQLSWMQRSKITDIKSMPMVQISYPKLKAEPLDYEEQDSTEEAVEANIATDIEGNEAFDERIVEYSENSKRKLSAKKKEENNRPSREIVKRNLFTAEIFDDEKPKVKTENPVDNDKITRFLIEKKIGEVLANSGLNRSHHRLEVLMPKVELEDISKTIEFNALLRKKSSIANLSRSNASSKNLAKSKRLSTGRKMICASKNGGKSSPLTEIKVESLDDLERSLRPRRETVDYSDSRRLRRMIRNPVRVNRRTGRIKKINISPKDSENERIARKLNENPKSRKKKSHFENFAPSPILLVKLERQDFSNWLKNFNKTSKDPKTPLQPRNNIVQALDIKTEEGGDIFDKLPARRDCKRFSEPSKGSTFQESPKNKVLDEKKRNSTRKYSPLLLRSQTEYLRNCNKSRRNFDHFGETSKIMQHRKFPSVFSAHSFSQKRSRSKDKSQTTILRHQYCHDCNENFASPELYKLHFCYGIKKQ